MGKGKTASKAKPAKDNPVQNESPQDPVHRLEILKGEAGPHDDSLLKGFVAGTSDAELIAKGKTILSSRIVTDTARLYWIAWEFYQGATTAQRKRLRGFSLALLRLAIHEALELHKLEQEVAGKVASESVAQATQTQAASTATDTAVALRDQAYDALRDAAQDESLRIEVDEAFGTADSAESLARGLEQMGNILLNWLGKKDQALLARLTLANLDADYAVELLDAAKLVKTSSAQAKRPKTTAKVSQGMLDRADGINILLLGQIIRAFEAANNIDPAIPRLVPISTRRLFHRTVKKKPESKEPPQNG